MGGVMIRDYHMEPELMPFLGLSERSFAAADLKLHAALIRHSRREISEDEFWTLYTEITGRIAPPCEGSLLGKFFHPRLDEPTVQIVKELKAAGMRVVAGTNVIDAHYKVHMNLNQYALFDKVYASHLMGAAKPEPAFYEYILRSEGLQAADTFFTDDVAENAEAATNAGLNAFIYTGAGALRGQLLSLGLFQSP